MDLHEGCGRTKLFWLMALADSKTMKAMVEFREQTGTIFIVHCQYKLKQGRKLHSPADISLHTVTHSSVP